MHGYLSMCWIPEQQIQMHACSNYKANDLVFDISR